MIALHRQPVGTVGIMDGVMSIPTPFSRSLMHMMLFSQETLCDHSQGDYIYPGHAETLSLHDSARNFLAMQMRGDWLLMLDTDISFEPDLLARLLMYQHRYAADVVGAVYCQKHHPHLPIAYMWNADREMYEQIGKWDESQDILRVDAPGTGALLIHRRVFEAIRDRLDQNPFDRLYRDPVAGPNSRANLMGEDQSFFARCRQLGIACYIAPKVHAYHLAYAPIDPARRPEVETGNEYQSTSFSATAANQPKEQQLWQ